MSKVAFMLVMMVAMVGVAQDGVREKLNTPPKIKMEPPRAVAATQAAVKEKRAARKQVEVREPPAPVELPPLISTAADALPARVSFEATSPYRVTGAPAMTFRLPNLISTPRRGAGQSNNPYFNPAPAVSTPPVNSVDGTTTLGLMPPFTRKQIVEHAPLPKPLAVGEEPYVQVPGVSDDADAPVRSGAAPAVRLE